MSLTENEQELKPCPFCKQVPSIKNTSAGLFWVGCSNEWITPVHYKIATILFDTEAEAIAAWNNYVDPAPAPQWASEVPTKDGRYVVRFDDMHYDIAVIIDTPVGGLYMSRNGERVLLKDIVSDYPNMTWFPLPPLPAEKEDTP